MKGLMPLFAPIIHERSGRVFNASEFAKAVQEKYDIAMRPIVAEGLIPKLVESGLLTKEEKNKYVAIYRYATGPEARILPRDDSFDAVLDEFCSFAEEALSQQKLSAVRETLKNAFLERLKSMEFLHMLNGISHFQEIRALNKGSNGTTKEKQTAEQLTFALDVLSAEFITNLTEKDPSKLDLLVRIASGSMIADVVLTLQQPTSDTNLSGLTIALDGPIIMDMLDLNTQESMNFARDLMDMLKRAKVNLITFKHVLEEIRGAILGTLEAYINGEDVHGPLGYRLRQDSRHATYARAVLDGLNEFIENLGIYRVDTAEVEGEDYVPYCPEEVEDALRNCLGPLHESVERRIKDAKSVASVIKMRKGHSTTASITESRFIFVTRNVQVARRTTDCLLAKKAIGYDDVPPCILDRQLAGVLWLCLGGSLNELTREKLLANCMDALYPRPNLLITVRRFLENLDPEKARIFEALMRDKRAQRCLLHRTFGYTLAVTQDNVGELLEEIKKSTADEVKEEAYKREKDLAQKYEELYSSQVAELNSVRTEADRLRREKDDLAAQRDEADIAAIERACKAARGVERLRKTVVVCIYMLAVTAVAYLSGKAGVGWWIYPLCGLIALAGFWFVPEKLFKKWIDKAWHKKLLSEIKASKIEGWDQRFHLDRDSCAAKKIVE